MTLGILGWDRSRRLELLEVMARGLKNAASTDPDVVARNAEGNRWIREQILAEARDRRLKAPLPEGRGFSTLQG
ncbi:hypothetical protein [Streptomyces sp. CA-106131]|uniref:hypothetical protein n=1 Tax=Streptomyces sp. CA-106131 TaxID=3240045 RepID=UPI003D8BA93A